MATSPDTTTLPDDEPRADALEAEAEAETEPVFVLPEVDNRERALPIRQADLNRLLLGEPGLSLAERERLAAFGRFLAATFHHQFYEKLRELKELYAPLDPDSDYVNLAGHSRPLTADADEEFLPPFEAALIRANYRELDLKAILAAVAAPNEMGLTYIPDFSLFEHLKVYVRGYTRITREVRGVRSKFRKQIVHLDAYQRLVVAIKFRPHAAHGPYVRSDVLYLRMYKDVPHVDMEMHLPAQGTKVRMRWIDKAQIASPLVVSVPTMAAKIIGAGIFSLSALTYPLLGSLIIAPISASVNSFFGFQRAKQKHLLLMIQKLYYQTLANNASVLTRLIDSAEDEEFKEAMLAYFFLWRSASEPESPTIPELDARIESFLKLKTGIEINFEVADAVAKLYRLGLVERTPDGRLHALPIDRALAVLDRFWDGQFRYK